MSTNTDIVFQAVFGTDLFNSDDTAGTINKFKITTVAVSVSTYFIAFLLVFQVERKWILPRTYSYVKKLSTAPSRYWKGQKRKMGARKTKMGRTGAFIFEKNGVFRFRNFGFKLSGFI